eukprot:TRINITY_DN1920_c0_g1_i5.p1 TRINITY_DN1920_c0_g1~~TRINITY_DN1920_c0_g1_i5.p1  ORF type:complete len:737 (+),score=231.80 TRINITY_DN1920_c0_g1_i5:82-2292(+)
MPAVAAGAEMHAAGWNTLGQCGDPETTSGLGALAGAAVQQIAQGYQFTLIIILGRLYHAGSNEYGQRGNGRTDKDPHPDFAEIPLPALAVEVVCGAFFSLVLLENGIVLSWGDNAKKQLGRGGDGSVPLPVEGLGEVRHVYAGHDFAFVLLAGGEVRAWGRNDRGQLCLGRAGAAEGSPQRVAALCGRAAALALSSHAGIALFTDDCAVAWGGLNGRLADDTGGRWSAERCCLPLHLRLSAVRTVGAGDNFLCAHLKDGPLVSWGDSDSGVLGRDGPTHVPTPVPFPGDEPIIDFFCLSFCLFAQGPSGWAACGFGRCGLPFGEPSSVCRLTLIPRPWVPCPRQGGTSPFCAFYVRAASESAGQRTLCVGAPSPSPTLPTPSVAAAQPSPTRIVTSVTLEESNFLEIYDECTSDKYEYVHLVDRAVQDAFEILSKEPESSSKKEFDTMFAAMHELSTVRDGVEFAVKVQLFTSDGEQADLKEQSKAVAEKFHNPTTRACVLYTAGALKSKDGKKRLATLVGRQMEFCSMLAWMIRSDRKDILTAIMPFCRALCSYTNVGRRDPDAIHKQWEKAKEITEFGTDAQGRPKRYKTLYRGGSLKSDCFPFFQPDTEYRVAAYLSTTPVLGNAMDFIKRQVKGVRGRCPEGFEPVLWKLLVDGERLCDHTICIERSLIYAAGGPKGLDAVEVEFLFSAYSWFQVLAAKRGNGTMADPTIITVRCAVDNLEHRLDVPTAPWC